jgi:glucose-6-phosphate 1-dehydrogenase
MSEQSSEGYRPGDSCVMVLFGATGDLTRRKLVPSLDNLMRNKLLPKNFALIGVARDEMTTDAFRHQLALGAREFDTGGPVASEWDQIDSRVHYVSGDFADPATYKKLAELVQKVDKENGTGGNILFYLATPPVVFAEIATQLGRAGLAHRDDAPGWRRIILEKPFGRDLESARALNRDLWTVFKEDEIYRIDHYLGKETVQNILVFRFANGIFEPIWNRRYIDHVQITVGESIGVEGRGGYYDGSGVLRDMIQNHMFQVMALIAMEPPISFAADAVRDEKVKVLHALHRMDPEDIIQRTVRGQYGAGYHDNTQVPAYRSEPSVPRDSTTETFAALKLCVDNWRWADVPFYLRSGKRLPKRTSVVTIQFRRAPLLLFRGAASEQLQPNRLVLTLQPEERMQMYFQAKLPGPGVRLTNVEMEFKYSELETGGPSTGYETLIYDCMIGDSTLFHRADITEAAWVVATPILDIWRALPPRDFPNYAAGSWGPESADELMHRDGRHWINP